MSDLVRNPEDRFSHVEAHTTMAEFILGIQCWAKNSSTNTNSRLFASLSSIKINAFSEKDGA